MTHNQIDFTNSDVIAEIERRAYAEGSPALAEVLGALHDALSMVEYLTEENDKLKEESLSAWEQENGPAHEYVQFFNDCFERLSGDYPCPSVTSDYDKGIIFLAIERGEAFKDNAE